MVYVDSHIINFVVVLYNECLFQMNKDSESHLHEAAADCICAALYTSEVSRRSLNICRASLKYKY